MVPTAGTTRISPVVPVASGLDATSSRSKRSIGLTDIVLNEPVHNAERWEDPGRQERCGDAGGLEIEIDDEHAAALLGQVAGDRDQRGRTPDAALDPKERDTARFGLRPRHRRAQPVRADDPAFEQPHAGRDLTQLGSTKDRIGCEEVRTLHDDLYRPRAECAQQGMQFFTESVGDGSVIAQRDANSAEQISDDHDIATQIVEVLDRIADRSVERFVEADRRCHCASRGTLRSASFKIFEITIAAHIQRSIA